MTNISESTFARDNTCTQMPGPGTETVRSINKWRFFSESRQLIGAITGKTAAAVAYGAVGVASDAEIDAEAANAARLMDAGVWLSLDVSNALPTGGVIPGLHPDDVTGARRALARLDAVLTYRGYPDWKTKLLNQDQRDAVDGALNCRDSDVRECDGREGDPIADAVLQFTGIMDLLVRLIASLRRALSEYAADKARPNYAYLERMLTGATEAAAVLSLATASPADKAGVLQRCLDRLDRNKEMDRQRAEVAAARQVKEAAERRLQKARDDLDRAASAVKVAE